MHVFSISGKTIETRNHEEDKRKFDKEMQKKNHGKEKWKFNKETKIKKIY